MLCAEPTANPTSSGSSSKSPLTGPEKSFVGMFELLPQMFLPLQSHKLLEGRGSVTEAQPQRVAEEASEGESLVNLKLRM